MTELTIVTINYNNVNGLRKTCASVYEQALDTVQHIIIDGGSTDGSDKVLLKYQMLGSVVVSERDEGIYDAMNKGLDLAVGRYVCFLNAGDTFYDKTVVRNLCNRFKGTVHAFYGNNYFVNEAGIINRIWRPGKFARRKYFYGWMTPHPATIIPKSFYEKYGNYDANYDIAADYELMFRYFFKHKLKVEYVDIDVVKMLSGGVSNGSISGILRSNLQVVLSWYKNGYFPPFWLIFIKPLLKIQQMKFLTYFYRS